MDGLDGLDGLDGVSERGREHTCFVLLADEIIATYDNQKGLG